MTPGFIHSPPPSPVQCPSRPPSRRASPRTARTEDRGQSRQGPSEKRAHRWAHMYIACLPLPSFPLCRPSGAAVAAAPPCQAWCKASVRKHVDAERGGVAKAINSSVKVTERRDVAIYSTRSMCGRRRGRTMGQCRRRPTAPPVAIKILPQICLGAVGSAVWMRPRPARDLQIEVVEPHGRVGSLGVAGVPAVEGL